MEYVSFEGLRLDGRRANETRRVRHAFGVDDRADGSARFEMGNTIAQATVEGPKERRMGPPEEGESERCRVEATYASSAFSAEGVRAARKTDRRAKEHSSVLTEALQNAVMGDLMPRCAVRVTVNVLCDDGGARAASVNAATLALIDAGVPMRDILSAVTVGYLDGETLVDLNKTEERGRGPELLTCAMLGEAAADYESREIVGEQLDRGKTTADVFDSMHDLALAGTRVVGEYMRRATVERTRGLASSRALEKF